MTNFPIKFQNFIKNKKGGPLAEYMPLLAFLVIIIVVPIITLGGKITEIFDLTSTTLSDPYETSTNPNTNNPNTDENPYEIGYPAPDGEGWCPPPNWGYNPGGSWVDIPGVVTQVPIFEIYAYPGGTVTPDIAPGEGKGYTTRLSLPSAQDHYWWGEWVGVTLVIWNTWEYTGIIPGITYEVDSSCNASDPTWMDTEGWAQGTPGDDAPLAVANGGAVGYAGNDDIRGTSSIDGFDPGPGNDIMIGGAGDDTYIIKRNYDSNLIREMDSNSRDDILRFEGINSSEVSYSLTDSRNDFTISFPGGSVSLDGGGQTLLNRMETIRFDNITYDQNDYWDIFYETHRNTGMVQFYGNVDHIYNHQTGFGSYEIRDHDGSDALILAGNESNWAYTRSGSNIILTNTNNGEAITWWEHYGSWSGRPLDLLVFDDGSYSGEVNIINAGHRDMVERGQSTIIGSLHGDTFYHYTGETYTINEGSSRTNTDRLIFDTPSTDWTFTKVGRDLVLNNKFNSDVMTLTNEIMHNEAWAIIEQLQFTDTTLSHQQYRDQTWYDMASQGDNITGSWWADNYIHEIGFGSYSIYDYELWFSVPVDTLTLIGTNQADWTFTRGPSNDLLLTHVGGEVITVTDMLTNSSYAIEQFIFNDGTITSTDVYNLGL